MFRANHIIDQEDDPDADPDLLDDDDDLDAEADLDEDDVDAEDVDETGSER